MPNNNQPKIIMYFKNRPDGVPKRDHEEVTKAFKPPVETESDDDLLTTDVVATKLTETRSTVWRKCREGEIPHVRLSKRDIRIRRGDLKEYLRRKTR